MSKKNKIRKKFKRSREAPPQTAPRAKTEIPKKDSWFSKILKPHIAFTFLAFIFGIGFLITTPPFQVPDEIAHFERAYKLSEFKTFQKVVNNESGDYLPTSIDSSLNIFRYLSWNPDNKVEKEKILEAFTVSLNRDYQKFTKIDAGAYFYFSYIPQYPAIYLGKIFDLNVLTILYLGRIFALIFYIICVRFAIRTIPTAKYLLTLVALMPMSLAQAGSSNADCVLFSLSFVAIAILLKLTFSSEKIKFDFDLLLLCSILLIIGVLKLVYIPLVLLIFLLPRNIFKNKLQYFSVVGIIIMLSVVFTIAWTKSNALSLDDPSADSATKIQSLIHDPFITLDIFKVTLGRMLDSYYHTMIGVLGYLDTVLPKWVYSIYGLLIVFLAFFEGNRKFHLKIYQRVLLLICPLMVFTTIILSMYLINPKENGYFVTGVQGRYFIPVLFPFVLSFTNLIPARVNMSVNKFLAGIFYIILFFALMSSLSTVVQRYYS